MQSLLLSAAAILGCIAKDVATPFGTVKGVSHGTCEVFLGVPYAQPPVGALRFLPPLRWTAKYPSGGWDARHFRGSCNVFDNAVNASEDCLYLNIFTPLNVNASSNLPVLLFVHGGAFLNGRSDDMDGTVLAAEHQSIIVTINYRLGSLGFLPFAELLQAKSTSGNQGLLDQRVAFAWVHDNIHAFGGDAKKVTIFGESAGAISVLLHTVMPNSFPYFSKVISESGFYYGSPASYVMRVWSKILTRVGCPTGAGALVCMQGKSVKDIIAAQGPSESPFTGAGWGPVIDGIEIKADPAILAATGPRAQVPLIAGSNTDEGTLFVYPAHTKEMNASEYDSFVRSTMFNTTERTVPESFVKEVLAMYPPNAVDNRPQASALLADKSFVCGTKQALLTSNVTDRYMYHFAHKPCLPVPASWGVYHSSELDFVFHVGCPIWTPALNSFAKELGGYWNTFAATGSPGRQWPRYTSSGDENIILNAPISTETGRRKKQCELWSRYHFDH